MIRLRRLRTKGHPLNLVRAKTFNVLSLKQARFADWKQEADVINHQLFERPMPAIHTDITKACVIRAEHFYDGQRCIGRANLSIFALNAFEPSLGRSAPIYACVGGGGVLPEYQEQVSVHPFVLRTMVRFHLQRPSHLPHGRSTYLLATNCNPIASYLLARSLPKVHPAPGPIHPGFERLRGELVALLYPDNVEEFERRGLVRGPIPMIADLKIREGNPLLAWYVDAHGGWREGDRLPVVARLNKSDIAKGVGRALMAALR